MVSLTSLYVSMLQFLGFLKLLQENLEQNLDKYKKTTIYGWILEVFLIILKEIPGEIVEKFMLNFMVQPF